MSSSRRFLAALAALAPALAGCLAADDDAADSTLTVTEAAEVTDWQNVVGVAIAGNDLTKTATTTGWNAGASSVATLTTDGYLEVTAGDLTGVMFGLGHGDTTVDYHEIDHAFQLSGQNVRVREDGVLRASGVLSSPGEVFRIQVRRGVVSYLQSSVVVHTSAVPATFPLLVDTSLSAPGAQLRDVVLVPQGVTWQNAVGVAVTGNSLVKTDGQATWAAGAASAATIDGLGDIEATTDEATTVKVIGLARTDADQSLASIDYAVYLGTGGQLRIYERGVLRSVGATYAPGTVVRIAAEAGKVRYFADGVLLYTSGVPPRYPLRADTSLRTPGATLRDVTLHDAGFGYPGGTYLKARTPGSADRFGIAVAASGATIAVGADGEASAATGIDGDQADDSRPGAGAAYVLWNDGAQWRQQAYVKASNTDASDRFGAAVAIDGDTMVVGAPEEASAASGVGGDQADDSMVGAGAAYVFVRAGSVWTQQAYLKSPSPEPLARFGTAVAISGNRIVVGAPTAHTGATGGGAYVYRRTGATWALETTLAPAVTSVQFGAAVAIEGGTIVVGATYGPVLATGSVCIFERPATTWIQTATIVPAHAAQSVFGGALAYAGGTLAVGGMIDTTYGRSTSVFVRSGATWSEQAYLAPPLRPLGFQSGLDGFGAHLAIRGDVLAVGFATDSVHRKWSGAAYRYQRTGATWSAPVLVKATNPDAGDQFGSAVAIRGTHLVIGAPYEQSAASGVDGDQLSNTVTSGAVYAID